MSNRLALASHFPAHEGSAPCLTLRDVAVQDSFPHTLIECELPEVVRDVDLPPPECVTSKAQFLKERGCVLVGKNSASRSGLRPRSREYLDGGPGNLQEERELSNCDALITLRSCCGRLAKPPSPLHVLRSEELLDRTRRPALVQIQRTQKVARAEIVLVDELQVPLGPADCQLLFAGIRCHIRPEI